ncbi:MAG: hypothetical protein HY236_05980 [Acidobacteria bacterium]|nr:hypothetical protein [Acidobacteriota bacterium]
MPTTSHAALGLRAHSGWAALVAVAGSPDSPVVIDKRRIELADPRIPGSLQPYHAAEGLPLKDAEKLVNRAIDDARRLARQACRAVLDDLREKGHEVIGCGILLASGRPLPALAATLASHALIHTAEGELFRDALVHASKHHDLPVTRVKERELYDGAAAGLGVPAAELLRRVTELGRPLGPPWRQDEKLATLVAWLALAAA